MRLFAMFNLVGTLHARSCTVVCTLITILTERLVSHVSLLLCSRLRYPMHNWDCNRNTFRFGTDLILGHGDTLHCQKHPYSGHGDTLHCQKHPYSRSGSPHSLFTLVLLASPSVQKDSPII